MERVHDSFFSLPGFSILGGRLFLSGVCTGRWCVRMLGLDIVYLGILLSCWFNATVFLSTFQTSFSFQRERRRATMNAV